MGGPRVATSMRWFAGSSVDTKSNERGRLPRGAERAVVLGCRRVEVGLRQLDAADRARVLVGRCFRNVELLKPGGVRAFGVA